MIVAHPDDIEAHCAGTVARLVERGERVAYGRRTSRTRGADEPAMSADDVARRREAEQLAAARVIGVERVHFLRYDDSDLLFHLPRLREELTAVIRRERPRTIIT